MAEIFSVNVRFSLTRAQIDAAGENLRGRILDGVRDGLDKGNEYVLGRALRNRFRGVGPFPVDEHRLGIVTQQLRKSLRTSAAVVDGDAVRSAIGSNIRYFGIHEAGFSGQVRIKAHRARRPRDPFNRKYDVKAHNRTMRIPARAPMRTEIEASGATYEKQIGKSLRAALAAPAKGGGQP